MKKFIILAGCLLTLAASAQGAGKKSVPLTVVVPEQAEYVPQIAHGALENKMQQIVNTNGMGATADVGQFFITCVLNVVDKQVVPGAPVKIAQKIDATFYVADAFNKRVFGTATVSVRGVGENENKSIISAMQQIAPTQPALKSLIVDANARIIAYYNEQCDNIIKKSRTLALARQWEEAFFQLSLIPEECECYPKIIDVADELFRAYIDDQAAAALAKARSIWSAGLDREAAAEAAEYLAQIRPEAKCYPEALELQQEIKARVKEDIDFDRKRLEWEQQNKSDIIRSWRDIGVSHGNNQQPITYNPIWMR